MNNDNGSRTRHTRLWPLALIKGSAGNRNRSQGTSPGRPRQPAPATRECDSPPASVLHSTKRLALAIIAALVAAASLVSFAESYRALYEWAHHHGLTGVWAWSWPLMIDVFIAVGELALFVALADRWAWKSRLAAWAVTLAGLAVSVAGNIGHASSHALTVRVTWAVPPLAAAAALGVGLGVLKRVVEARHTGVPISVPVPASGEVPARVPTVKEIRARRNCSQATAEKIRLELKAWARQVPSEMWPGQSIPPLAPATPNGQAAHG